MDRHHTINAFRRALHRVLMTRSFSKLWSRILHRADGFVLWLNGGRFTITSAIAGLPTIVLTTVGAKSGLSRTLPIACVPDGDKYALVASNLGQPHFPAWYHNLKANPECRVRVGNTIKIFIAREIHDVEYEHYWKMAVNIYAGFEVYRAHVERRIPVMVLEPKK